MRSGHLGTALVGIIVAACGGGSTNTGGAGGEMGIGGSQTSGGHTNTGAGTGGAASSSTGGASANGGEGTGGNKPASGGSSTAATSSSTGGRATGGKSATSGPSVGGRATGGEPAAGGSATGGKPAAGGATGAGGAQAGGTNAAGGKSSTGGASTGANTGGGQSVGGKTAVGGSSSTGGTTASAGATSAGGNSGQSSGCGKTSTITQYNNGQPISISVGGTQRRYVLNIPTNYDKTHPYRLVVVYHQRDGNDKQMYNWQYYGLLPLSNNSTIFVAPNGQKDGSPCSGTGDGESNCGWPNTNDADLKLADAVVAQIEENFCIDTNRIFATGWSYGGSMSYRTACSRPLSGTGTATWGVRGIAIYSAAQLSGNCTPSKPVAFYASHGTRDSVLNYDSMGLPLAQSFASVNGCTWATPTKVTSGNHVCTKLSGCTTGYPEEFCSFNGDHTPYPDTGQAQGSWGPQEAWTFLSQF